MNEIEVRVPGGVKLADSAGYVNRFEIKSASSNRLYVVAQRRGSGEWCCSCPGWIRYRYCKHLKAIATVKRVA